MSNYTKPDDKNFEDTPEDWLLSSLLFARAIGFLLPENIGIVINLTGDMCKLCPDTKKVIICNVNNRISVVKADERTDLKEGDRIQAIRSENIQN